MLRSTFFCLGLLFVGSVVQAANAPSDLERLRIPHEKFVLDNGLTVLVHEDKSVPLVAVNLWYHVGSRDEKVGRTGFAHLFEHFFFNGSENYPHGFREAMDDLGANNRNGTTSTDRTNFFEDVPLSGLERTLYLEADRMGYLAGNLSEEMLERERGVVKNEKRQGENQPYGRVFSRVTEVIYPKGHPYSWSTIGSMEDLDAAKLSDIKDWYAAYYGPNNAVLSLAGDISPQRARELVEKYFGSIAPGAPIDRLKSWVPQLPENIRDSMQDRVPQQRIYRLWHLPPMGDAQTDLLELFGDVLSGSDSAPLRRRLVFDLGLATDVGAFVWGKELTSTFIIQLSVKPGADAASAERELDLAINQLIDKGLDSAALARAKTSRLAGFTRGLERLGGMGGRSDILAEAQTYFGDSNAYMNSLQHIDQATPDAIRAAAKQWLRRPHYTLYVNPFPELKAGSVAIDRTQLPALTDAPDVRFPKIQEATLKNGLKIRLMERHSAPLVNMVLSVNAGSAADGSEKAGTANLALDMLLMGTTTRDTFRIADDRDALGAVIGTGNSLDASKLSMNAQRAQLAGSLSLFADIAQNPSFPSDMLEVQRKQQLTAIAQQKASPTGAGLRIVPTLLYGPGHAYAQPLGGLGSTSVVSALTRDDLVRWHAAWFKPNNAALIVAGDITMDELLPMLEKSFASWKMGETPTKNVANAQSTARGKVHLIDKPGAPQSIIVAAQLGPIGAQENDLSIETVMRNFGGMATSRLNRNLRLDKHWSYGTQGLITSARGARAFIVLAPVQTDKTSESIQEVIKEIRGIDGERPLQGEELQSILRSQAARLPGRFETLNSLIDAASDVIEQGRNPDYYYNYASNLRALDASQLNQAGADLIDPDALTWMIIGDLQKIEAGVRALNLGPVVPVDTDGNPKPQ